MDRFRNRNFQGYEESDDSDIIEKISESTSFSDDEIIKKQLLNIDAKDIECKRNKEEFEDLIRCYICLLPSNNPVICRYCGNIACKTCFYKWVESHAKCGCCRKRIIKSDLISPPIIEKIYGFLTKVRNEDKKDKQCILHQEKILYFCANCIEKFCGKCLFFNSEESKKHLEHNILEYSEIKKSNYNELINQLVSAKETMNTINVNTKIYEKYKEENKIKYNVAIKAIEFFSSLIINKFQEKDNTIIQNTEKLKNLKEEINTNCMSISKNLQKIEKIEKPIDNFNIDKYYLKIKEEIDNVKELENSIEKVQNNNNNLKFKTINFPIKKLYKDIIKKEFVINDIPFKFKDEDNEYISITIPNNFYKKDEKKTFYLYPMLTFNDKIYEFSKDEEKEKENRINIINSNNTSFNYKTFIKINDLSQTEENAFNFSINIFTIY